MRARWLLVVMLGCTGGDAPKGEETGVDPPDTSVDDPDGDGDGIPSSEDCDDTDAAIYPGATENCDGSDEDCDGDIDEDAVDAPTWYGDGDADGWGEDADSTVACDPPVGSVDQAGDCDDADPAVHPGAAETDCEDPTDYDCDGETLYADADGDGSPACVDCDDSDPEVSELTAETCDGLDNNCDGQVDEGLLGLDEACAVSSCAALLEADPSASDGMYYLDPSGSGEVFQALCDMSLEGGGWTQLVEGELASLSDGVTRRYLYTYEDGFYLSPTTELVWSWSAYTPLEGTWTYGVVGGPSDTFDCTDGEDGYWGVGCSNGPGSTYKVLPWGDEHNTTYGAATVCQDLPDVFSAGACAWPTQIWVREE